MKNKRFTITIGIPAYNEDANIKSLLLSLLHQEQRGYTLYKILVVSDGSTDRTVHFVKSIKNKKIHLIEFQKRKGLNQAQNEILKRVKTDVLVMLNGDVLPVNDTFIIEMVKPLLNNKKIGLVGASLISVPRKNFLGRILSYSYTMRRFIYRQINKADNVYLCHGQARAFSKDFYTQLKWPDDCPEDAYSYFECSRKGFAFFYNKSAEVFFALSTNFSDHTKQSNRFFYGRKKLEKYFSSKVIRSGYRIPLKLYIKALIFFLIKAPITLVVYLFLLSFIRFFRNQEPIHHSRYEVSVSSKSLLYEKG